MTLQSDCHSALPHCSSGLVSPRISLRQPSCDPSQPPGHSRKKLGIRSPCWGPGVELLRCGPILNTTGPRRCNLCHPPPPSRTWSTLSRSTPRPTPGLILALLAVRKPVSSQSEGDSITTTRNGETWTRSSRMPVIEKEHGPFVDPSTEPIMNFSTDVLVRDHSWSHSLYSEASQPLFKRSFYRYWTGVLRFTCHFHSEV